MRTAGAAPALAVAVNASAYQLAAALAGWLGGEVIGSGPGLRALYPAGAAVTVLGILLSCWAWLRDRTAARPGGPAVAAPAEPPPARTPLA